MKRVHIFSCFLILALLVQAPSGAQNNDNNRRAAAAVSAASDQSFGPVEQITAAQLRDYLYFISSDELEGRDTPSRGLDIAAKFIAMSLSRWGVKPAGDDGTYFQRISLRLSKFDTAQTRAEVNGQKFKIGDDFLAQTVTGTASGSLVYVGHGWLSKSKNIDPYQGIDVRDRIMIVAGGRRPKNLSLYDLKGVRGEDWDSPVSYALRNGARGLILIPSYFELSSWGRVRQAMIDKGLLSMDGAATDEDEEAEIPTSIPVITPSMGMLNALFRGERRSGAEIFNQCLAEEYGESFELSPNKRLTYNVRLSSETINTQNVVGIIEGTDPQLRNEYVALGAHYDHVGIDTPIGGDEIYNGADDDGTGTVALLAMAETLARSPRPRRSMLFVWHSGEEKGLWGSKYFTEHPTVPLNQIIAQLNIDMIGRSKKAGDTNPFNKELTGPHELYVIGSKVMSTDLGELSERVNRSYLNLNFNYNYDNPRDPNRFFFRSDHFNYALKGIPVIFYFSGPHEDYHRPGDTADKIDYTKFEKITRTIFATAWTLANEPQRPRVDKRLPAELRSNR